MTLPLFESYREISLTQGQVALVDEEDFDRLSQHKWYAKNYPSGHIYAVRHESAGTNKQRTVMMHREVLGLKFGDKEHGDHISQTDTLDNRKSNLRRATIRQNQFNQKISSTNTSGYKGVTKRRFGGYEAGIRICGNKTYLGKFRQPEDAARAYDRAAMLNFGEFAHLNFPRSDYDDITCSLNSQL